MTPHEKTVHISAGKSMSDYWKEIWEARELFWILAKRDVLVRYKQSVLGVAWGVIRPLLTALVMVFAFGKIAKLDQDTAIPYILIVMPGIIIWFFFSQALSQISGSIVGNTNLIGKVYFPRLIIPLSSFLVGLIDAAIAFGLFLLLCVWYKFMPDWRLIFAPVFLILSYLAAFGFGLIAAVINVKFRDVGQIIPFLIQFGYFASPVAYTSDRVQGQWWTPLYNLNPVVGAIDAMRWSLLGGYSPFNWSSFLTLVGFVIIFVSIAIKLFRSKESGFVDHI